MSLLIRPAKMRIGDSEDKGRWVTINGNAVHIDENGNPDKGNPEVVKAMKSGGKGEGNPSKPEKKDHPKDEPKKSSKGKKDSEHIWREALEAGAKLLSEQSKGMRAKRDKLFSQVKGKGDATYDLETGKQVSFTSGIQVTFQTTGSEDEGNGTEYLSDEQYDKMCAWMMKHAGSDARAYCGVFGSPEISFHFSSFRKAKQFAQKFNQNSTWPWKGGILIPNKFYDPKKNTVKGGKQETTK